MKHLAPLLIVLALISQAPAQEIKRDIPYAVPALERQVLDVYAPRDPKSLPVVFWIHGGGWRAGDKSDVQVKPNAFVDKGFVFVSTNYRLLPNVDMDTIVRDIAKSIGWVHAHIAEHGGDPQRILVMGHSAGAQLAALVCTDDRYLKAEGVSFSSIKGCVPVDGDTYDVPAIIEVAETRNRVHGFPPPTMGHREKFGNTPAKHKELSVVTYVAKDKGIPPFLVLYVADHPDTSAQARRLGNVMKEAGLPVTLFGASETTHNKINADIGVPETPVTKAMFDFVGGALEEVIHWIIRLIRTHRSNATICLGLFLLAAPFGVGLLLKVMQDAGISVRRWFAVDDIETWSLLLGMASYVTGIIVTIFGLVKKARGQM